MQSNIQEAERMLDLFTSVGARSFFVTKIDVEQKHIWGKMYSATELRGKLPAMVRTAADWKPYYSSEGKIVSAGENLIIRPTGDVAFVQLDDLTAEQLDRVRLASFLIIGTSPGNHQAWIAVSGVEKSESKEFVRRVRNAVGGVDKSASGAVRMAGSENFKLKYWPDYPTVTILHGIPGRVMTQEQLGDAADCGLGAGPACNRRSRPQSTSCHRLREALAVLRNHAFAHAAKERRQRPGSQPRGLQLVHDRAYRGQDR